jgi:hypothetical protein
MGDDRRDDPSDVVSSSSLSLANALKRVMARVVGRTKCYDPLLSLWFGLDVEEKTIMSTIAQSDLLTIDGMSFSRSNQEISKHQYNNKLNSYNRSKTRPDRVLNRASLTIQCKRKA